MFVVLKNEMMTTSLHFYFFFPNHNIWQVDVFSFGISMWEIWTGEEPYADMHCGAIIGKLLINSLSIYYMKLEMWLIEVIGAVRIFFYNIANSSH